MTTSVGVNKLLLSCACAALGLTACGSSTSNTLEGSVKETFNLNFDEVAIWRQEKAGVFIAMKVEYIQNEKGGAKRYPAIVVINAPVAANEQKDLVKDGALSRAFDGSQFSDIKTGNITFDELGAVGESASGKFYVTFVKGTTLNGEFSGTVKLLSPN
jgi:hypothetical protein